MSVVSAQKRQDKMEDEERCLGHEVFHSIGKDGAHWRFTIMPGDTWAITRDGATIATGACDGASLGAGVRQYLSLTVAMAGKRGAPHPDMLVGTVAGIE